MRLTGRPVADVVVDEAHRRGGGAELEVVDGRLLRRRSRQRVPDSFLGLKSRS